MLTITITCDACGENREYEEETIDVAERVTKQQGWVKVNGDWFCAECHNTPDDDEHHASETKRKGKDER